MSRPLRRSPRSQSMSLRKCPRPVGQRMPRRMILLCATVFLAMVGVAFAAPDDATAVGDQLHSSNRETQNPYSPASPGAASDTPSGRSSGSRSELIDEATANPRAPPLPASTPELDRLFGVQRSKAAPTAKPNSAAPLAPTLNAQLPPQEELDKLFGVVRPAEADPLRPWLTWYFWVGAAVGAGGFIISLVLCWRRFVGRWGTSGLIAGFAPSLLAAAIVGTLAAMVWPLAAVLPLVLMGQRKQSTTRAGAGAL